MLLFFQALALAFSSKCDFLAFDAPHAKHTKRALVAYTREFKPLLLFSHFPRALRYIIANVNFLPFLVLIAPLWRPPKVRANNPLIFRVHHFMRHHCAKGYILRSNNKERVPRNRSKSTHLLCGSFASILEAKKHSFKICLVPV